MYVLLKNYAIHSEIVDYDERVKELQALRALQPR